MEKIAVVGSGLVGCLQAIMLANAGYEVHLFEKRGDLRKASLIEGRSINLALSYRGWEALEEAGVEQHIKDIAIPMVGRCMHAMDGKLTYQPYGKEGQAIYSVSRGELNKRLLTLAGEKPNVYLYFHRKCEDLDLHTNTLIFENEENGQVEKHTFDRIFAADGAYSAVRVRLQKSTRFDFSQKYLSHGYKELYIPAGKDGKHLMDKNHLHIWPRGEFMMIALANLDGSFTCTLFFPLHGEKSFDSLRNENEIFEFFQNTFPDAIPLMPQLVEVYKRNPVSPLMTVRCHPWNYEDKVTLIGDAAHACVPFYGQGMNCGFEDVRVFNQMLKENRGSFSGLLDKYAEFRRPDGEAIADLSLDNYVEMREKVGDPRFLLQKKIENKFSDLYPDLWMPLYSQVTFSNTRYSEAYRNGKKQDEMMEKILEIKDIETRWDEGFVMEELLKLVK